MNEENVLTELCDKLNELLVLFQAAERYAIELLLSLLTSKINIKVMFKWKILFSHNEHHDLRAAHQCIPINCSKTPPFRDILTFSTARDMHKRYIYQYISMAAWIHLISVLKDHAIHTDIMCRRGGKYKGLIRWINSPSSGYGEGICDIISLLLSRKFLTNYISGRGWNCNYARC